jgi:signal transduction histidine kinase
MFFILVLLYQALFGSVFDPRVYLVSLPVGVAFVVLFNAVNSFIRNQVTLRFINPGYNPLEANEQFSNNLNLVLDLDEIANQMQKTMTKTIRPNFTSIIIFPDQERGIPQRNFDTNPKAHDAQYQQHLEQLKKTIDLLWEATKPKTIIRERIQDEIQSGIFKNVKNLAQDVHVLLESIGARALMPLATKDDIEGMFILGQKEADSPYAQQDIEFLDSIAKTSSVAIERSLLYSEVQEFARTLQQKVDERTAELKKTNRELGIALNDVQEARRKERDMLDVMGHELRTPISVVRNALAMMEREYKRNDGHIPDDILRKYMEMGLESSRREIRLIETLLSATKVDASRLQLYFVKVDAKDVLADAIEGQRAQLKEKGMALTYNPPAEDLIAYADRTRIQEIADNFLSNAVKYTLKGSITMNVWQEGDNIWYRIADSGMGIDEEDLKNLGKKFFRAKQYTNTGEAQTKVIRPGGTGLGLYVTFELIRVMGGHLFINSTVGKGTTFTFSMPAFNGQEDKQIDQTFETGSAKSREHIIINGDAPQPPGA